MKGLKEQKSIDEEGNEESSEEKEDTSSNSEDSGDDSSIDAALSGNTETEEQLYAQIMDS